MSFRTGVRIGVDVGTVRVGVAMSDEDGQVVLPLKVLKRAQSGGDVRWVADLALEHEAIEIVVGMPLHLSGKSGQSVKMATTYAHKLAALAPFCRILLVDERLLSKVAHQNLSDAGVRLREHKGKVDALAAAIILEQSMDIEKQNGTLPGQTVAKGNARLLPILRARRGKVNR